MAAAGENILASEVVPDIEVRARASNASLACAPRPPRFVRADSTKSPPFFRVALQAQTLADLDRLQAVLKKCNDLKGAFLEKDGWVRIRGLVRKISDTYV
eukprot:1540675-Prymnesium_polylepis.1